jgi:hypothetical protein
MVCVHSFQSGVYQGIHHDTDTAVRVHGHRLIHNNGGSSERGLTLKQFIDHTTTFFAMMRSLEVTSGVSQLQGFGNSSGRPFFAKNTA